MVDIEGGTLDIEARVVPDPADDRDLYRERSGDDRADRPRRVGPEPYQRLADESWHQRGQECTGFALAALANYLTRRQLDDRSAASVSRRMLYEMAQRYDGQTGPETSTLRGALRGWSRSGAARDALWPYHPDDEDGSVHGTLTVARLLDGRHRRLARYRKIRDGDTEVMKDALADGHPLYVSARLHDGWYRLFLRDDDEEPVIEHLPDDRVRDGGHAFVVVGYDDDAAGFWIHNSWGPEWGVEGYALLPYGEWEIRGQDAWVVDLELTREQPQVTLPAPTSHADETFVYREMWPHLVVLRDDGELASEGLYEMDAGSVSTLLYLFQEATIGWGRRRLAIVTDGGYWPTSTTIERYRTIRDQLLEAEIYPIFVVWETPWWSELVLDLHDRFGRVGGADLSARERERSAVDGSVAGLLWYELHRRSLAACDHRGGAALLAEAVRVKRDQEPTARRGPFDLHLVSHGVGDLLAAGLAQRLPAPLATTVTLAPATSVEVFDDVYGAMLDAGAIEQLTLVSLDTEAHALDRIGPLDRPFLDLVSDLRIDAGEATAQYPVAVGRAAGVPGSLGEGGRLAAHGASGRFVRAELGATSHTGIVSDAVVLLVETMLRQESDLDRRPVRETPTRALPTDPLARAQARIGRRRGDSR